MVPLPRDKRGALLAYLAIDGGWVSRERLSFLLWPDTTDAAARRNLRQLLTRLKRHRLGENVEYDRTHLRWDVRSDLSEFRAAVESGELERAHGAVRQDICLGLELDEAEGWTGWLEQAREGLRSEWRSVSAALARELRASGRATAAAVVLEAVWHADLLDDDALHDYLRAAREAGQRDEALKAFAKYEELLAGEFGLEPLPETRALVASLQAAGTPVSRGFFGRESEREELLAHLNDPSCRLVALTGEGGVGKTRLALEVLDARAGLADLFPDGLWFTSLTNIDATQVVPEIARVVGLALGAGRSGDVQLEDFLRDRSALLVLDSFEHVMAAVGVVASLLEAAPALKVLMTSRQAPELPNCVTLRLQGLDRPEPDDADLETLASSAAGGLLLARAAAANRRFRPSSSDAEHLANICSLTAGLPLALELAGAMFKYLDPAEVAHELGSDLAALDTPRASEKASAGEIHHAVAAVFERSWRLLADGQREDLGRLSVFEGGLSRADARAVFGVDLGRLLALVARSLLVKLGAGRYDMHPVIRRFAGQKLEGSGSAASARRAHADHFLGALAGVDGIGERPRRIAALERLAGDGPNVAVAWRYGAEVGDIPKLEAALRGLEKHVYRHSTYPLGVDLLRAASELVEPGTRFRAKVDCLLGGVLCRLGRFEEAERLSRGAVKVLVGEPDRDWVGDAYARLAASLDGLGRYAEARELYQNALDEAEASGERAPRLAALTGLGLVAMHSSELATAETRFQEALGEALELGHDEKVPTILNDLALAQLRQGKHAEGLASAERSLAAARQADNEHATAEALTSLGIARYGLADNEAAREAFEESLRIQRRIGNRARVAAGLNNLAGVAHALGDLDEATGLARESLEVAKDMGDERAVGPRLHNLGNFLQYGGHSGEALTCFEEALAIAERLGHEREASATLAAIGSCLVSAERSLEADVPLTRALASALRIGAADVAATALVTLARVKSEADPESAFVAAAVVLENRASLPDAKRAARELLADVEPALVAGRGKALRRRAVRTGLESVALELLAGEPTQGTVVRASRLPGSPAA